ncbi:cupin domain-containing protein [Bauldia litoralis]|uniref:Uncharacterized conserved protein, cupin superfamily n=1 Tax=Bauldia litoralis TaxID=665467 RepID=A0A1G6ASU0_9HYPH|nr:cupin domain-containing protein [Bauldia litoralis]SDB11452.1 Uncharacterized conserved protein, cupin superfamily [Bauldia litoralis]
MSDTLKPVVNISEVDFRESSHGDKFAAKLGRVGPMIGSDGLGCTVTIVPPGKAAFPFHAHHCVDEMFVVLVGTGEYRIGDERYPVKSGDVLAAPAGGPETAHQIINTGEGDLQYLAFSSKAEADVVEYPDSGKFAVTSRHDWTSGTGGVRFVGRPESSVGYWDGE